MNDDNAAARVFHVGVHRGVTLAFVAWGQLALASTAPRVHVASDALPLVTLSTTGVSHSGFRAKGDGTTDDTEAIRAAIEAADGGQLLIPPGTYSVTSITASIRSRVHVSAHGVRLVSTTQVAESGTPILRINGTPKAEITIEGIEIVGPRSESSHAVGTGAYRTRGYPSGLDINVAQRATIDAVRVTGTYFAGIEAHWCEALIIRNSSAMNHAYAGILFSDCASATIHGNRVDNIGAEMVATGYGITAATSHDAPGYATQNGSVHIFGNLVTRTKRKGIDIHNGLRVRIADNWVIGFGYAAIFSVCEGPDKRVRDVVIEGNHIRGDASFVPAAAHAAISVGSYGPRVDQDTSFDIAGNHIDALAAPCIVFVGNSDTIGRVTYSLSVERNTIERCTLTTFLLVNNHASRVEFLRVVDNKISATCSDVVLLLRHVSRADVEGNSFSGTAQRGFFGHAGDAGALMADRNVLNGLQVRP